MNGYKQAIYDGFKGYIAKTMSEKEIIETLEKFNKSSIKSLIYEQRSEMGLTDDEKEV